MRLAEDLSLLFKTHDHRENGKCLICGKEVDERGLVKTEKG